MSYPIEKPKTQDTALDDKELIQQVRSGDNRAFDQLVLQYQQEVFAVAFRMLGEWEDAKEVAQDTFIRAYRAIGTFRHDAKFSTWVIAITLNLCRNRRRWWARRKRFIVTSLDAPRDTEEGSQIQEVADPAPGPAMEIERREKREYLLKTLQMLSEPFRNVVVLRDLQGYSYEEIARMLGVRVGTVKSRLNRARWQLKALLDGQI